MKKETADTVTTENIATAADGLQSRMEALNQKLQKLFAAVQEKVRPAASIATVVAGVYSAAAAFALLLSLTGNPLMDVIADSVVCEVIFRLLFAGAMVGLVLTGGILTALGLFVKAAGKILGRGHVLAVGSFAGFIISLSIHLCISAAALILVALFLFAVPIVPILMRRKNVGV